MYINLLENEFINNIDIILYHIENLKLLEIKKEIENNNFLFENENLKINENEIIFNKYEYILNLILFYDKIKLLEIIRKNNYEFLNKYNKYFIKETNIKVNINDLIENNYLFDLLRIIKIDLLNKY